MKKNLNERRLPSFSLDFEKGNMKEEVRENRSDNRLFVEDVSVDLSYHEFHECRFDFIMP